MKKIFFLLIITISVLSCTNNTVVQLDNGAKVKVIVPNEAVIKVGDKVLVSHGSGTVYRIVSGVSGDVETVKNFNKSTKYNIVYYGGVVYKIE